MSNVVKKIKLSFGGEGVIERSHWFDTVQCKQKKRESKLLITCNLGLVSFENVDTSG